MFWNDKGKLGDIGATKTQQHFETPTDPTDFLQVIFIHRYLLLIFLEWKFDLIFAPDFNTVERGTEVSTLYDMMDFYGHFARIPHGAVQR